MAKNEYKEKYEREINYISLLYPQLIKERENLLKSLIYLEWQVDQKLREAQTEPKGYKERKEQKYHREQSIYIYKILKMSIHEEIEKYFRDGKSKSFDYTPIDELPAGFGSSMFFE